jgi:hypothetical protein
MPAQRRICTRRLKSDNKMIGLEEMRPPALLYRESRVIHAMALFPSGCQQLAAPGRRALFFYPPSRVMSRYPPESLEKSLESDYIVHRLVTS